MDSSVTPERPVAEPWAYFLTIACYGARLHGDSRGSVDCEHNAYQGRYAPADEQRELRERLLMSEEAVKLAVREREVVLEEIRRTCQHEGWALHAAHVRSTHLHVVVTARQAPEEVAGELKAYTSRALNREFGYRQRRWVRHASTVWLWERDRFYDAIDYVVRQQGAPMALYVNPHLW